MGHVLIDSIYIEQPPIGGHNAISLYPLINVYFYSALYDWDLDPSELKYDTTATSLLYQNVEDE